MPEELVYYHDEWMIRGWPARIDAAQRQTTYSIDGRRYQRVPYGQERWGPAHIARVHRACHDCKVFTGQFHVPGCDMERCPRCGGQSISCGCPLEGEPRVG